MKANKWRLAIISLIGSIILLISAVGIYASTSFIPEHLVKVEETQTIAASNDIDIFTNWQEHVNINIMSEERDDIAVIRSGYVNKKTNFSVTLSAGQLQIKSILKKAWYQHAFNLEFDEILFRQYNIDIKIPNQIITNLTVATSTGNVIVKDVNVDYGTINGSSGKIEISNSQFNQLTVSGSSGNIYLNEVLADNVVASNSSGRLWLSEVNSQNVKLTNSSGSIKALGQTSLIDQLEISNSSASVEVDCLFADLKIKVRSGSAYVYSYQLATKVNISVSSGSIHFFADYAYTFYAKASSGSLKIAKDLPVVQTADTAWPYSFTSSSGNINLKYLPQ